MVKKLISSASLTLQDLSDAIISGDQPANPKLDQLWIKRVPPNPDQLFRWNGTAWVDQTLDLGKLDPDADGKIEKHETTIGNMVDDAKIDITERQEVKNKLSPIIGHAVLDTDTSVPSSAQLWNAGVGEVWAIRKAAQNVGIKTDDPLYLAVETNWNNLSAYLNALTPVKSWDASNANKDKIITVVPTEWRGKWLEYYKSVQNLTTAVQTKLQGNIDNIDVGMVNLVDKSSCNGVLPVFFDQTGAASFGSATNLFISDSISMTCTRYQDSFFQIGSYEKSMHGFEGGQELTVSADLNANVIDYHFELFYASNVEGDNWLSFSGDLYKDLNVWKRRSFTFKLPNNTTSWFVRIYFGRHEGSNGKTINFKNVQIEKGNKATSWKPSIKDVNDSIVDASTKTPNIIMNSAFLLDGKGVGDKNWTFGNGVSVDKTLDFGGVPFVRSIQSGLSADSWRGAASTLYAVAVNKKMTASVYSFSPDITLLDRGMNLEVRGYDINKVRIINQTYSITAKPSKNNTWERASLTFEFTDKNVKYMDFFIYVVKNGTGYFAKPLLQIGNNLGDWSPNPNDLFIDSIDSKAEESKNNIANMSNDSKLTPIEKVQLKKEWGTMVAEKPQFEALANSLKITTELNDYINAYNTLNNTLNGTTGYLKNMQSTDDINGATFRAQFDTYYAKQAELIKKVNNLIQGNIDGIQGVKNLLLASKRAINVNDYLLNDFTLTEDFIAGQDYTFVVKGTVPSGQSFGIWQNGGSTNVGYATTEFIKGVYYVTFKAVATTAGNQRSLRLYNVPQNTTNATVEWVALYKGTKPFDWTAAPEDADIGKTNLFIDSEFKYLTNWIRHNPSATTVEGGIMPNGVKNVRTLITTTGYYDFAQYIEVQPNTEYTFSCNAGGNFQIFLWEKKADKTATNVYKDNVKSFNLPYDMSSPRSAFTYTIKTQPDAKYIHFIFRVNWSGSGTTGGRIALPQLERGTTASEWTPNPFDNAIGEIFIQGSGADQTDKRRMLSVNGKDVYVESVGRGLRLVTLKRNSLEVVENILYDVYGTDTAKNDLATKLNSLGDDVFITLTSYDAIQWNMNLRNAMIAIGGSGADATYRMPYAFIGMKGLGRYNGLEQYTGTTALFGVATISAKVKNGMLEGVNNNTGASDNIMRQDLRITAPLPTSISLDANGITASTTTAGKYARLDYRGLYVAGGAIQIDGGLTEAQLASGVTSKFTYIDSSGVYTGKVVASQIQGGTITGVTINVDTNLKVGNEIRLGIDNGVKKKLLFNDRAYIETGNGFDDAGIRVQATSMICDTSDVLLNSRFVSIGDPNYPAGAAGSANTLKFYGNIDFSKASITSGGVPAVFG